MDWFGSISLSVVFLKQKWSFQSEAALSGQWKILSQYNLPIKQIQ